MHVCVCVCMCSHVLNVRCYLHARVVFACVQVMQWEEYQSRATDES